MIDISQTDTTWLENIDHVTTCLPSLVSLLFPLNCLLWAFSFFLGEYFANSIYNLFSPAGCESESWWGLQTWWGGWPGAHSSLLALTCPGRTCHSLLSVGRQCQQLKQSVYSCLAGPYITNCSKPPWILILQARNTNTAASEYQHHYCRAWLLIL